MRTMFFILMSLVLSATIHAQSINQEISMETGEKFLVGEISKAGLSQPYYAKWFTPNYTNYKVNTAIISNIKEELHKYHILVFLGTWCGDSKKQVPRFLKILASAKFPENQLKIVALDKRRGAYKQSPTREEWGLQILRVPTFVIFKNGREVNRIIESPNTTLEEDLEKILKSYGYSANKAKSLHFD